MKRGRSEGCGGELEMDGDQPGDVFVEGRLERGIEGMGWLLVAEQGWGL